MFKHIVQRLLQKRAYVHKSHKNCEFNLRRKNYKISRYLDVDFDHNR